MDKPLGILPDKVDAYKSEPEPPKQPVTRPPPAKAGKHKLRVYTTGVNPTPERVSTRRAQRRR